MTQKLPSGQNNSKHKEKHKGTVLLKAQGDGPQWHLVKAENEEK